MPAVLHTSMHQCRSCRDSPVTATCAQRRQHNFAQAWQFQSDHWMDRSRPRMITGSKRSVRITEEGHRRPLRRGGEPHSTARNCRRPNATDPSMHANAGSRRTGRRCAGIRLHARKLACHGHSLTVGPSAPTRARSYRGNLLHDRLGTTETCHEQRTRGCDRGGVHPYLPCRSAALGPPHPRLLASAWHHPACKTACTGLYELIRAELAGARPGTGQRSLVQIQGQAQAQRTAPRDTRAKRCRSAAASFVQ